jgi:hypothetical protein
MLIDTNCVKIRGISVANYPIRVAMATNCDRRWEVLGGWVGRTCVECTKVWLT